MRRVDTRKLTDDPVLLRIIALLKEQGQSANALMRHLSLPLGTLSHWKYDGNRTAHLQYIPQICEFLSTTPNYLFYGKEPGGGADGEPGNETGGEVTLTDTEAEIIRMARMLDPEKREWLKGTLEMLTGKTRRTKE